MAQSTVFFKDYVENCNKRCKRKMKAMRHLVCVACSSMIDFELCGTEKTRAEAKEAVLNVGVVDR